MLDISPELMLLHQIDIRLKVVKITMCLDHTRSANASGKSQRCINTLYKHKDDSTKWIRTTQSTTQQDCANAKSLARMSPVVAIESMDLAEVDTKS